VQAPSGRALTTQLYFPDEPRNRQDGIYNPALVMAVQAADDAQWGSFNFVVDAG
jgi:protocatechuate 3,4-dioxygenase beta subunit